MIVRVWYIDGLYGNLFSVEEFWVGVRSTCESVPVRGGTGARRKRLTIRGRLRMTARQQSNPPPHRHWKIRHRSQCRRPPPQPHPAPQPLPNSPQHQRMTNLSWPERDVSRHFWLSPLPLIPAYSFFLLCVHVECWCKGHVQQASAFFMTLSSYRAIFMQVTERIYKNNVV